MPNEPAPPETLSDLAGEYLLPALAGALGLGLALGLVAPRGIERRLGRILATTLSLVEGLAQLRR
jgi:hypothetical protein